MAAQDELANRYPFELTSLPQPASVKNPDNGQIVNGYKVTVRSLKTGATAQIEVPADRYVAGYVAALAKAALEPLDDSVAKFGSTLLTGSTPAGTT